MACEGVGFVIVLLNFRGKDGRMEGWKVCNSVAVGAAGGAVVGPAVSAVVGEHIGQPRRYVLPRGPTKR